MVKFKVVSITQTRCGQCARLKKNSFSEGYSCPKNPMLLFERENFAEKCGLFQPKEKVGGVRC